jgi:hypothetical protein
MGTYSERAWKYVVLKSRVPFAEIAANMGRLNPALLQFVAV